MNDNNLTTRKQILTTLRKRGPKNAHELAKVLGITGMGVRRHLNALERDRLVRAETVRQAMGRPTFVYSLTDAAELAFPKNYADISLDFLDDLHDVHGPELIEELFRRREKRLEQKYKERFGKCASLEQLVEALARVQEERGYMAEWAKDEDTVTYWITEHNCPIHAVAHRYTQACSSELSLFRAVLDAEVEQVECKAKGGERCVYSVRPKTS